MLTTYFDYELKKIKFIQTEDVRHNPVAFSLDLEPEVTKAVRCKTVY